VDPKAHFPLSPVFIGFAESISDEIKSAFDDHGILVYEGYNEKSMLEELERLAGAASLNYAAEGGNAELLFVDKDKYEPDKEEAYTEGFQYAVKLVEKPLSRLPLVVRYLHSPQTENTSQTFSRGNQH